ncbi:TRAP transporter small permease [Syntrophorhabdus aromaticivorans]|uniref:TRAP transporter small permease n=1 Tax=Syntrophorhabdus aromaticivorans TaxID=328301 RepID=UPI000424F281|nr:TRAP transporter small permease [Syntrophorhabdus aromaticivorans]
MDDLIKKLNKFEEGLVGAALLGLAILTFIETALRYTISYTFAWFGEFANYTMIFCTYLGAAIGVKYGTHFSMEALTEYAPDRVSHLLKTVAYAFSGTVCILFLYYGIVHILKLHEFEVKSSAMQLPMFIPYIPIPLFSISMGFRFFVLSQKHFGSFLRREPFQRVRRK